MSHGKCPVQGLSLIHICIAEGLTTAVAELRWDTLGRVLTDGMRAAILTLYNFVLHYSGWTDLGNGIATCISSAITNIPWLEAGLGVGGFAIGLLLSLIHISVRGRHRRQPAQRYPAAATLRPACRSAFRRPWM